MLDVLVLSLLKLLQFQLIYRKNILRSATSDKYSLVDILK